MFSLTHLGEKIGEIQYSECVSLAVLVLLLLMIFFILVQVLPSYLNFGHFIESPVHKGEPKDCSIVKNAMCKNLGLTHP